MPAQQKDILLVVTGSVAAIKTLDLIGHLRDDGFAVQAVLTDSSKNYGFVKEDEVRQATGKPVLNPAEGVTAVEQAEMILVSPSTAGFISQIANETTDIGKAFHQTNQPRIISPAMNIQMWTHPATQRNMRELLDDGWHSMGPVEGMLACQEHGYGRMLGTEDIARGVRHVADGEIDNPVITLHKQALTIAPTLPQEFETTAKGSKKVLLVVQGGEDAKDTEPLVQALQAKGCDVTCALSQEAAARVSTEALAKRTGHTVYTKHYEDDERGMEHINLSRVNDMVLVVPATGRYVEEMAQGGATSFVSDIYLATNKPVLVVPTAEQSQQPGKQHLERIRQDGVTILSVDRSRGQAAENIAEQISTMLENQRRK